MAEPTVEWWRKRLTDKLVKQKLIVESLEAWYEGSHPLPAASATNSDLYRRFQKMAQANYVGQVVNAVASRLAIEGVRIGNDPAADEDAWMMWQDSQMDAAQTMLLTTALSTGLAYLSVWPSEDNPGMVSIAPEHPAEVTHELAPGSLKKLAAGLKIYPDEIAGDWVTTLWLPGGVYEWRSEGDWEMWSNWTPTDEFANPYGEVPIRPLLNKPTLRGGYSSEMSDGIPIQRRINQTLLNLMVAEEAVAFPQRWATGLELQKDAEGNAVRPYKSGADSLWVAEDETVKFGEFSESKFEGYLAVISNDVETLAAVTATPMFAMSAKLSVPPSAEALTAMESSLVKKIEARQRVFGEAVESTIRLGFKMQGDERANATDAEVIWADPSIKSDAAVADYVVKAASVGVPQEALWEKLGASPQEISRWSGMAMSEAFKNLVMQVGEATAGQPSAPPAETKPTP
jgi:hypothetical protein